MVWLVFRVPVVSLLGIVAEMEDGLVWAVVLIAWVTLRGAVVNIDLLVSPVVVRDGVEVFFGVNAGRKLTL